VLVDRYGQRRLILPSGAVHAGAVIALAIMLRTGAPNWLLVLPALVFGFSYISVASLVRARGRTCWTAGPSSPLRSRSSRCWTSDLRRRAVDRDGARHPGDPVLVLYLGVALIAGGRSGCRR